MRTLGLVMLSVGALVAAGAVAGGLFGAVTAIVPLAIFGLGVAYTGLCCLGSSAQEGGQPPM